MKCISTLKVKSSCANSLGTRQDCFCGFHHQRKVHTMHSMIKQTLRSLIWSEAQYFINRISRQLNPNLFRFSCAPFCWPWRNQSNPSQNHKLCCMSACTSQHAVEAGMTWKEMSVRQTPNDSQMQLRLGCGYELSQSPAWEGYAYMCICVLYVRSLLLNCYNGSSILTSHLTVAHFLEL